MTTTRVKMTIYVPTVDYPLYVDSWKHEWRKYPSQGSEMNFGSEGELSGDWIVTRTKMLFGAMDTMEIWLKKK